MITNHLDIVRRLYDEQRAETTISGALAFVERVLAALPANERAGLLLKPAGENIIDYHGQMVSAGRICYPDGQLYKVLTDIPTTNGPSWQDDGTVDPSRYLAVTHEPEPQPETPPPVDDRVDQLIAKVDEVLALVRAHDAKPLPPYASDPLPQPVKFFGLTVLPAGFIAVFRPR